MKLRNHRHFAPKCYFFKSDFLLVFEKSSSISFNPFTRTSVCKFSLLFPVKYGTCLTIKSLLSMRTFPRFLWPMGYENDITFFRSGGRVSILAKVQFLKGSKDIFLLRLRPWWERNNKDAVYFQIKLTSTALPLFCWDLEGGFYAKEKTQTVKFTRKIKRNTQQNTQVFCIVMYRIHLLFTPCVLFSSS